MGKNNLINLSRKISISGLVLKKKKKCPGYTRMCRATDFELRYISYETDTNFLLKRQETTDEDNELLSYVQQIKNSAI